MDGKRRPDPDRIFEMIPARNVRVGVEPMVVSAPGWAESPRSRGLIPPGSRFDVEQNPRNPLVFVLALAVRCVFDRTAGEPRRLINTV